MCATNDTAASTYCDELQKLIMVTLDEVIIPLRESSKKWHSFPELILEIQDAENKTFEYIAMQISTICNTDEHVATELLTIYPNSESSFRCLGVDEDTMHGFLYIRGIQFSFLLDMPDDEVEGLLKIYGCSKDEIDRILNGLFKIRRNIDILESGSVFEDDKRNLIKLATKLSERREVRPIIVTDNTDDLINGSDPTHTTESSFTTQNSDVSLPEFRSSAQNGYQDINNCACCNSAYFYPDPELYSSSINSPISASVSESNSFSFFVKDLSCSHISDHNVGMKLNNAQNLNRSFYPSKLGIPLMKSRNLSPSASTIFLCDSQKNFSADGGLSVPTTPFNKGFGTNRQKTSVVPSKDSFKSNSLAGTADKTASQSSHSYCHGFVKKNYYLGDRDKEKLIKMPVTPPPKRRVKFLFTLHRSKSHDSNLTNKLNLHNTNTNSSKNECVSPGSHRVFRNVYDLSGSHSPNFTYGEGNFFSFPTPKHANNSQLSPRLQHISSKFFSKSRTDSSGLYDSTSQFVSNGFLSVPGSVADKDGPSTMPGYFHRFEIELKLGDFVRGRSCPVCHSRIGLLMQHCIYCNIKTHRHCVSGASALPCCGPSEKPESEISGHSFSLPGKLLDGNRVPSSISCLPLPLGSDSNSASSCTSCSTPGSPFIVDTFCNIPFRNTSTTNHSTQTYPSDSVPAVYSSSGDPITMNNVHISNGSIDDVFFSKIGNNCRCDLSVQTNLTPDAHQNVHPSAILSAITSVDSSLTSVGDRLSRLESFENPDDYSKFVRKNSLSMILRDWNIPLSNLQLGELIGRGTFGTVYRGSWHGEVAVKLIDFDPHDSDGRFSVEVFKREIATLHKARHENLVLFMGACMKPPDLAIITQLSSGETLHYLLHFRKNSINTNRSICIASQMCKGMGYLHARDIVHRDLKSTNIFIEANNKVVIADFGLFNFVSFCRRAKCGSYVRVPPNWLCYVAPEIICSLNIGGVERDPASQLPFTKKSDVFAFGTLWYELLNCEYPFKGLPTETLLYLVGNGVKPPLQLSCRKDYKDIMIQCWAYHAYCRPEFTSLVRLFDRLPKLNRSPSYPSKSCSTSDAMSREVLFT